MKRVLILLTFATLMTQCWADEQPQPATQVVVPDQKRGEGQQSSAGSVGQSPTGAKATLAVETVKRENALVSDDLLKLRDPFKIPDVEGLGKVAEISDLERFNADEFKMIGILTGPERMRAMVLAPNGRTYFVSEKSRMGARKGVIQKVSVNSIQVREKMLNVVGQEENIDTEIRLVSRAQLKNDLEEGERSEDKNKKEETQKLPRGLESRELPMGSIPMSINPMVKGIPSSR